MKKLGNYLMLGLWGVAFLWFIFGIKVNIVDMIFTIVLTTMFYLILHFWND